MRYYCPHCKNDISELEETEYGIVCSNCHNDFWGSERLTDEAIAQGYMSLNELRLL